MNGEVQRLREATKTIAADLLGKKADRIWLAVAVFLLLTLSLSIDIAPSRFVGVRVGQPSLRTIRAPASIRVEDVVATNALKRRAADDVPLQYSIDTNALPAAIAHVDRFFTSAEALAARRGLSTPQKVAELRAVTSPALPNRVLATALSLPRARLEALSLEARRTVSLLMVGRVTVKDLPDVRQSLEAAVAASVLPVGEREVLSAVGASALGPTFVEDTAREAVLRAAAVAKVKPVVLSVDKGEVIVRQGSLVTREHLLLMRALGLNQTRIDWARAAGSALVVLLGMIGILAYVALVDHELYMSTQRLTILAVLVVMVAVLGKIAVVVSPLLPFEIVPVVAAPMLATILVSPRAGFLTGVASAIVITGSTYFSSNVLLWSLFASIFAVVAATTVSRRSSLYRASLFVILTSGLVGLTVALFSGVSVREAVTEGSFGLVGGLVGAIFTIGLLPFFENVFRITTDLRLADLINPNQPLLRELMLTAPGTYTHSVTVANLAETAAEAVGASAMLARTGAYYHDIGKMKRPSFFVENQIGGTANPHDHTNPRLSFLVIAAHVKGGVELAEQNHLPEEVIDIIRQHHGTGVVQYFYQRAVEQEGYAAVKEEDFRYEGTKPQSREAAIVMLADSVEAAARVLVKPTPQRIEQTCRKIVQSRIDDGQLDESHLNMRELDTIVKSFTSVLAGMYHARIEYPEITRPSTRKAVHDGSAG